MYIYIIYIYIYTYIHKKYMYTYYTYGVLCEREREKGWIYELHCNVVHGSLPPKKEIKKKSFRRVLTCFQGQASSPI